MDFRSTIEKHKSEIINLSITTPSQAEEFRQKYLGTTGILKTLSAEIKNIPADQRKETGQMINEFKQFVESTYEPLKRIVIEKANVSPSIPKLTKIISHTQQKEIGNIPIPDEPINKRAPLFEPGEKFWTMINDKAIECSIGSIETKHTVREFSISYNCYFSRSTMGIVVDGMPDAAPITRKENRMFKTKELLLASL